VDGSEIGIAPERLPRASRVEATEASRGVSNYLIGPDSSRWIRRVPQYGRVAYRGIRPGVDLVFHTGQDGLEYDVVVAPGADPDLVRLRYSGARRLALDPAGDLIIYTRTGRLRQKHPVVYQEIAAVRQPVEGSFVVEGRSVGFRVGA
jgi:hypothetical protein